MDPSDYAAIPRQGWVVEHHGFTVFRFPSIEFHHAIPVFCGKSYRCEGTFGRVRCDDASAMGDKQRAELANRADV
jgi:hypothetical protein